MYCQTINKNSPYIQIQPPQYHIPSSAITNAGLLTLNEEKMVINKSKLKFVLKHHERTSKNSFFLIFAVR